jgi:signal transduction histidine kinase
VTHVSTDDTAVVGRLSRPPSDGLDPLGGHSLVARLTRVSQWMRQWDRDHRWVLDVAVVVMAFLVLCVPDLMHEENGPHDLDPRDITIELTHLPVTVMLALQAGLVLPLLWRRRAPLAVFVAIAAVFLLQWSLGAWLRADVALFVALYSLALHGRPRHLAWACAAIAAALVLVAVRVSAVVPVWDALFVLFSAATAAVALGLAVRIRRTQLAVLRDRAARLEIERDQRSKLAAANERARMAREMHDVVGHNLSVIITLADGGAYAADVSPDRAKEALQLIGDTGRQALGELRRMLGVLREQRDVPELSPQPGSADIDALCARVRAAGPQVVYRTAGDLDALDRGVQLTVYRIVQEALTNTLKHAGPDTRAYLGLTVEGSELHIHVEDTGPPDDTRQPARSSGEGHGLAGMRERAALYAGTVVAGPRPGGGWTVRVTLDLTPLPGPEGDPS